MDGLYSLIYLAICLCRSVTKVSICTELFVRNLRACTKPLCSMCMLDFTSLLCHYIHMYTQLKRLGMLNVYIILTCTSSICMTLLVLRSMMPYDPYLAECPGLSALPSIVMGPLAAHLDKSLDCFSVQT